MALEGLLGRSPLSGRGHISKPDAVSRTIGGSDRTCVFCRLKRSRYNCPRCNAPYCSLECYRVKSHQACVNTFESRTLKDQLGSRSKTDDGQEREQMMEILRRLEVNDQDGNDERTDSDNESEEGDGEGEAFGIDPAQLDGATTEELLAMLSVEDRKRFEDALQDPKRATALADKLFATEADQVVPTGDEEHPDDPLSAGASKSTKSWWTANNPSDFADYTSFTERVERLLPAGITVDPPRQSIDLRFNVVAVLMAYCYVLRYLDIPYLSTLQVEELAPKPRKGGEATVAVQVQNPSSADSDDDMPALEEVGPEIPAEKELPTPCAAQSAVTSSHLDEINEVRMVAIELIGDLVPFLIHSLPRIGRKGVQAASAPPTPSDHVSRTVLESTHDAVTWILTRLGGREASRGQALERTQAIATQLLQDARAILTPSLVVLASESDGGPPRPRAELLVDEHRKLLVALSDLASLLAQPSTAKLAFYASHILLLPSSPSTARPSDGQAPHPRSLRALLGPGKRSIEEELDRFAEEGEEQRRFEAWDATQRATASMGEVLTSVNAKAQPRASSSYSQGPPKISMLD